MYTNISIQKTEFSEKYLLKIEEETFYIGYLTKDIIEFVQKEIPLNEIPNLINIKHDVNLNTENVEKIVKTINEKVFKSDGKNLIKLFSIINTKKITNIPKLINKIYTGKFFYLLLFSLFLINTYAFIITETQRNLSNIDLLFLFCIVPIILLLHEFGHHISANAYGVNTDAIGFGIYGFIPVLYIYLGKTWVLNAKKRVIINLSGIYTQLIIGLLIYISSLMFDNFLALNNLLHLNFIVILVNLNPFFKFDGYWIVSDLLKNPDLLNTSHKIIKNKTILKSLKKNKGIAIYTILRTVFIYTLIALFTFQLYKLVLITIEGKVNYLSFLIPIIVFVTLYKKIKYEFKKRKNQIQKAS